jgi:hypothetical protein
VSFNIALVVPQAGDPDPGYRVERHPYGVAVFGPIPVSDFVQLAKAWGEQGWTLLDSMIAQQLGASAVAVNEESARAWRQKIDELAAARAGDDRELEWILGCDVGTSSAALLWVLGKSQDARHRAYLRLPRDRDGEVRWDADAIPHDGDDLGRCVRLLDRFPEWRWRLSEVGERLVRWRPFVARWGELEALFRSDEEVFRATVEQTGSERKQPRTPRADALVRELAEEGARLSADTTKGDGR